MMRLQILENWYKSGFDCTILTLLYHCPGSATHLHFLVVTGSTSATQPNIQQLLCWTFPQPQKEKETEIKVMYITLGSLEEGWYKTMKNKYKMCNTLQSDIPKKHEMIRSIHFLKKYIDAYVCCKHMKLSTLIGWAFWKCLVCIPFLTISRYHYFFSVHFACIFLLSVQLVEVLNVYSSR